MEVVNDALLREMQALSALRREALVEYDAISRLFDPQVIDKRQQLDETVNALQKRLPPGWYVYWIRERAMYALLPRGLE